MMCNTASWCSVMVQCLNARAISVYDEHAALTKVAEMPGYPTKKLLFGGPETRTKAAIRSVILYRARWPSSR